MKLVKHRSGKVVVLQLSGRLDDVSTFPFGERIEEMIQGGDRRFVFDLQDLEFVSSAGLGHLIHVSREIAKEGGQMVVARPSRFMQRTLAALGMADVFPTLPSVEAAVRHLGGREEARGEAPGPPGSGTTDGGGETMPGSGTGGQE